MDRACVVSCRMIRLKWIRTHEGWFFLNTLHKEASMISFKVGRLYCGILLRICTQCAKWPMNDRLRLVTRWSTWLHFDGVDGASFPAIEYVLDHFDQGKKKPWDRQPEGREIPQSKIIAPVPIIVMHTSFLYLSHVSIAGSKSALGFAV